MRGKMREVGVRRESGFFLLEQNWTSIQQLKAKVYLLNPRSFQLEDFL